MVVPEATGVRETRDGVDWVVYTRRIRASTEQVWAAWTEPEELARWVGKSDGVIDGPSDFFFTFEGDDLLPMTYRLDHMDEGRALGVTMSDPGRESSWRLEMDLIADGDATVLRVAQVIENAALAPSVAAGWEFYLDRLVAILEGREPDRLDYDEYFLNQAEHYRQMFPVQKRRPHS
jgi:uncharacterized protein YndB with AHSA1/START domain